MIDLDVSTAISVAEIGGNPSMMIASMARQIEGVLNNLVKDIEKALVGLERKTEIEMENIDLKIEGFRRELLREINNG